MYGIHDFALLIQNIFITLIARHVDPEPGSKIQIGANQSAVFPAEVPRPQRTGLIEKAEQAYDEKKAAELEQKLRESKFTLTDYLEQFEQIRGMGSMEQLMGMMPGVKGLDLKDAKIDEKQIDRMEAIIRSMTVQERENPDIISSSRRKRIAQGSGTTVEDVNKLLKQFEQTNKLMKQLSSGKGIPGLGGFGGFGNRFTKKKIKKNKKKKK